MESECSNGGASSPESVAVMVVNGNRTSKDQEMRGPVLSFHDINYSIPAKVKRKTVFKPILKDANGIFNPGMNAILGPTGSGKTSLLDILARRKDPRGLTGTVLVDGTQQPSNFKCVSGYVVQDDTVMGTLTVRENLAFSAALRLQGNVGHAERKERVEEVISELGLQDCANTRVGTEFIRGVSGGERKRTNVGMELITKPTVLFLDEPTTGLDASTAGAVMLVLASLAKRGRTIIFSIHQPRFSIYRLFDTLHLLSRGETVYHGKAGDSLDYFESIGYRCQEHNNPPDFFLDVINDLTGSIPSLAPSDSIPTADTIAKRNAEKGTQVDMSEVDQFTGPQASLPGLYKQSAMYSEVMRQLEDMNASHHNDENGFLPEIQYGASFVTQMKYVSKRTFVNFLRNPQLSIFQPLTVVILGVLLGMIYWQLDTSINSGIQNRVGAFLFLIMNMVFGNMSAIDLFIRERAIFIHESASGYYRVSTFFFSKIFCDLIPMRFIPAILFGVITYWMLGLQPSAGAFFFYIFNLILTTFTACGLAFAISCTVTLQSLATLFISTVYVIMLVFSGLLVNISSMVAWLQWLQYLSIFRYSLNALSVNELVGLTFSGEVDNGTVSMTGESYLEGQGIDYSTWGLWQNEMALALLCTFFMTIAYIQLRVIPKYK